MRRYVEKLMASWRPSPAVAANEDRAAGTVTARPPFPGVAVHSWAERQAQLPGLDAEYARRRSVELALVPAAPEPFDIDGFCAVCNAPRSFHTTFLYAYDQAPDGRQVPNWREHLVCRCGFGNRVRAAIHYLLSTSPRLDATMYITEQTTPLYTWLTSQFPHVIGSEYMGDDAAPGAVVRGFRHENLEALSFPDRSVDYILSFDVLEHVADAGASFRDCFRVLKPGGWMIFTTPFTVNQEAHTVRAVLHPDGRLEHILPPEYHGNPIDPQGGSLCFRYFGWQMMDDLRAIGFTDAHAMLYWSRELGYLGGEQVLFVAGKPAA